jgi:hypothetical protein
MIGFKDMICDLPNAEYNMQFPEVARHDDDEMAIVFREMEEERENALKRQGAKEALLELKSYLLFCAMSGSCKEETFGLLWANQAIDYRLSDLIVTAPEVGGAFPLGYFENIIAEGGVA